MRLKEAFLLFTDLLSGGTEAFNQRWQEIQSRPPAPSSVLTRFFRTNPEARWHFWAILGMIGINYLILVHVPTWVVYWGEPETVPAADIVSWEPDLWEKPLQHWESQELAYYQKSTPLAQLNAAHPPVDVDPVPINLHQIRRRVQVPHEVLPEKGTVRVRLHVLVDERGEYVTHQIAPHGFPALAKAVETQVGDLSFLPALRNGRPVTYWVEVSFVFDL